MEGWGGACGAEPTGDHEPTGKRTPDRSTSSLRVSLDDQTHTFVASWLPFPFPPTSKMAPSTLRYGPQTPPTPVTVAYILGLDLVPTDDPFEYLIIALERDFYPHNHGLRVAGKVFTAVLAL